MYIWSHWPVQKGSSKAISWQGWLAREERFGILRGVTDREDAAKTLIDVAELAGMTPAPVLLDVRWRLGGPPGIDDYLAGHVPGAVFVDLDRDLSSEPGASGRHPMPAQAGFQAAMRRAGVRDGRLVVVYDEADSTVAARAWWLLRYFGHREVRVLNGGYRAWTTAGQPAQTGAGEAAEPGDFTASPGHMPLLDAADAARVARDGVLIDARAAERYRGETEPIDPVAGHIPGAVSIPTAGNVKLDGTFTAKDTLYRRFAGLDASKDIAVYCGSGVTAAHEVLALEMAGITAGLYVGSWSNWVADPARPVAVGAEPG